MAAYLRVLLRLGETSTEFTTRCLSVMFIRNGTLMGHRSSPARGLAAVKGLTTYLEELAAKGDMRGVLHDMVLFRGFQQADRSR
jgi:hypothetical protein